MRLVGEAYAGLRVAALARSRRSDVVRIGPQRDRDRLIPVRGTEGDRLAGRVEACIRARGDGLPVAEQVHRHRRRRRLRQHQLIGIGLAGRRDGGLALGLQHQHARRVGGGDRQLDVAGVGRVGEGATRRGDRLLNIEALSRLRCPAAIVDRDSNGLRHVVVCGGKRDRALRQVHVRRQGRAVRSGQIDRDRLARLRLLVQRQLIAVGRLARHDRGRSDALVDDQSGRAGFHQHFHRRQLQIIEGRVGSADDGAGHDDGLAAGAGIAARRADIDRLAGGRAGGGKRQGRRRRPSDPIRRDQQTCAARRALFGRDARWRDVHIGDAASRDAGRRMHHEAGDGGRIIGVNDGLRGLIDQRSAGAANDDADAVDERAVIACVGAGDGVIRHRRRPLRVGRYHGSRHVPADDERVAAGATVDGGDDILRRAQHVERVAALETIDRHGLDVLVADVEAAAENAVLGDGERIGNLGPEQHPMISTGALML